MHEMKEYEKESSKTWTINLLATHRELKLASWLVEGIPFRLFNRSHPR